MTDTYVRPEKKRKVSREIFISWLDGSCGKNWQEHAEGILDDNAREKLGETVERKIRELKNLLVYNKTNKNSYSYKHLATVTIRELEEILRAFGKKEI